MFLFLFFFQAEDGIRDLVRSRGLGDVYKRQEIPKGNGKTRLLGVPTVVDRWLQQAVGRQLATKFELEFEEQSYGFRPQRNIHKAVQQSLKYINDGYQDLSLIHI
eukprot:TRINITY_DN19396_c0_g1_i1.p1 TRINITY_DN19396_c0_g1~~TRINITY_DN19396_c0_g1_i1.p1  ORF type:complete len:105 (+),score=24.31 TRINITY_DN19396_c0_g1_i1:105-419(+)